MKKDSKYNNNPPPSPAAVPPAPPPNSAKPPSNHLPAYNVPPPPKPSSSSVRSASNSSQKSAPPDNPPIAPPIVVVSPDSSQDGPNRTVLQAASQDRLSLCLDSNGSIPRTSTLNRLRAGPKDTIPMVGKPPRKQRSSRFIVTEKVDIERLPPFLG